MGGGSALVPQSSINWTQSVGSQIHGVTDGIASQDVVTVHQAANASLYLPKAGGTMTGNITFTNTTYINRQWGAALYHWAYHDPAIVVGPSSDGWRSWFYDYVTDGDKDEVEVDAAQTYANGKVPVVIVAGIYNFYSPANITVAGTQIQGCGHGWQTVTTSGTVIENAAGRTAISLFLVTGNNCQISNLHLHGVGTMSAGYGINLSKTSYSVIDQVNFDTLKNGVDFYKDSVDAANNCWFYNTIQYNIECNNANEIYLTDIEMYCSSAQSVAGIYSHAGTVDIRATNVCIMQCGNCMSLTDLTTGFFTMCSFDQGAGANGAAVYMGGSSYLIGFSNCWFSTSTASGYTGVYLDGTNVMDVIFSGCTFQKTGYTAINVVGGHRIIITGCNFYDCAYQSAAAVIAIQTGGSDVTVTGCQFRKVSGKANAAIWCGGDYTVTVGNNYGALTSTLPTHKADGNNL